MNKLVVFLCLLSMILLPGCSTCRRYTIIMNDPPLKLDTRTGNTWMFLNGFWVRTPDRDFDKIKIEIEESKRRDKML